MTTRYLGLDARDHSTQTYWRRVRIHTANEAETVYRALCGSAAAPRQSGPLTVYFRRRSDVENFRAYAAALTGKDCAL